MEGGKYEPFRLWLLIVAWIFQLLFLICALGLYILVALAISLSTVGTNITYAVVGVEIALAGVSIISILVEIILCASYNLSPLFYLVSNVIKCAIWIGLTTATLVIYHSCEGDTWTGVAYNGIGIGVSAALLLFFLLSMIYGAILYHKDHTSESDISVYTSNDYDVPTHYESNIYQGAAVPRPDFIDLEDSQGNGFLREAKSHWDRVPRREVGPNGQSHKLTNKTPESFVYA